MASERRTRSGAWSFAAGGRLAAARLAAGAVGVAVDSTTVLGAPSVGTTAFDTDTTVFGAAGVWSAVACAGADIGSAWSDIVRSGRIRPGGIPSAIVRFGTGWTSDRSPPALAAADLP